VAQPDWIVVGAGFTGATFAERMASAGRKVLVVDARSHIGGNAFDDFNEHGILVHRYGPHVFHTNSDMVWNYLSRFTKWLPYEHKVLGLVEGKLVPIPFNLNSLALLFAPEAAARVEETLVCSYGSGHRVPILKLMNSSVPALRDFGHYIYEQVYAGYTFKQWGLRPEELNSSVTARVPIRVDRDDRYFLDKFQAMPRGGYAAMFSRMLAHPNITVQLNCCWSDIRQSVSAEGILYTGALDELLDYRFGALQYRSCRFEHRTTAQDKVQPVGTINYPNSEIFTRVTEQKFLTGQVTASTTLVAEYPEPHEIGQTIAYYPVPRAENEQLYRRYLAAAKAEHPRMLFSGRLADYQYYNMDQACARALTLAYNHGADLTKTEVEYPQHEGSFSQTP